MIPISPPTDNLYKFCAITGVIILLISIYVPLKMDQNLRNQVAAVGLELSITEIELEYLKKETTKYQEIIKNFKDGVTPEQSQARGKLPLLVTEKEFKEGLAALQTATRDEEIKTVKIRSAHDHSKALIAELHFVRGVAIISITISTIIAVFGFILWYKKVQIYQDKIIKREAK